MEQELNIEGVRYISSKRASELSEYSQDYIGQLARAGSIDARRVSGLWYVSMDSIQAHKKNADSYKPEPPNAKRAAEIDTTVSLDGKSYISSSRAAKITGYTSDYVGQLARSGKILSKQVGARWYVDQDALLAHKQEKDALLASVQVQSVGIEKTTSSHVIEAAKLAPSPKTHFSYTADAQALMPTFTVQKKAETPLVQEPSPIISSAIYHDGTFTTPVPIKVIHGSDSSHSVVAASTAPTKIPITVVHKVPNENRYPSSRKATAGQQYLPSPRSLSYPMLMGAGAAALTVVIMLSFGINGLSEQAIYAEDTVVQYQNLAGAAISKFQPLINFVKELIMQDITYTRH